MPAVMLPALSLRGLCAGLHLAPCNADAIAVHSSHMSLCAAVPCLFCKVIFLQISISECVFHRGEPDVIPLRRRRRRGQQPVRGLPHAAQPRRQRRRRLSPVGRLPPLGRVPGFRRLSRVPGLRHDRHAQPAQPAAPQQQPDRAAVGGCAAADKAAARRGSAPAAVCSIGVHLVSRR